MLPTENLNLVKMAIFNILNLSKVVTVVEEILKVAINVNCNGYDV